PLQISFRRSRWAGADWCGDQSKAPPPATSSRRAAAQLEADCQAGRCWEAFSTASRLPTECFPLRADCPVPPSELAALKRARAGRTARSADTDRRSRTTACCGGALVSEHETQHPHSSHTPTLALHYEHEQRA